MHHSQSIRVATITDPDPEFAGMWLIAYGREQYVIDPGGGRQRPIPTDRILPRLAIGRRAKSKPPQIGCDPVDTEDLLRILKTSQSGLDAIVFPDATFPEAMAVFRNGTVRIWSEEKVERWKSEKGL